MRKVKASKEMTEFVCTKCGIHELIPTYVVTFLDANDPGAPTFPPMFDCEKCDGKMRPVYFVGHTGIVYTYNKD